MVTGDRSCVDCCRLAPRPGGEGATGTGETGGGETTQDRGVPGIEPAGGRVQAQAGGRATTQDPGGKAEGARPTHDGGGEEEETLPGGEREWERVSTGVHGFLGDF